MREQESASCDGYSEEAQLRDGYASMLRATASKGNSWNACSLLWGGTQSDMAVIGPLHTNEIHAREQESKQVVMAKARSRAGLDLFQSSGKCRLSSTRKAPHEQAGSRLNVAWASECLRILVLRISAHALEYTQVPSILSRALKDLCKRSCHFLVNRSIGKYTAAQSVQFSPESTPLS